MYDLVLMTGSFSTGLSAAGCAAVCAVPCAEALAVTRAGSRKAKFLREYFIKPLRSHLLEVELHADPDETRRQNGQRLQPGPGPRLHGGVERLVVVQNRAGVGDVEDVGAKSGPCPPESQDLRDLDVDLVDPVAPHFARLEKGDDDEGRAAGDIPAERRRHHGIGGGVVRAENRPLIAAERPAQQHVDLRYRVRADSRDPFRAPGPGAAG